MKRLLPVLRGFEVLLGMQQAQAYDHEHLKLFKETNKCPTCRLGGADLQDAKLQRGHIQDANLQGANLQ